LISGDQIWCAVWWFEHKQLLDYEFSELAHELTSQAAPSAPNVLRSTQSSCTPMQDWLQGTVPFAQKPAALRGRDAIVWSREYSRSVEAHCKCAMLEETLSRLGAERMVVGHTIQQAGINGACDNKVLRRAPARGPGRIGTLLFIRIASAPAQAY
jgi:hypothetical protein